ncbi:putative ERV/ALR sulfhydryl oxidase domain superfamily [Dioscorea sansibarensis]
MKEELGRATWTLIHTVAAQVWFNMPMMLRLFACACFAQFWSLFSL